MIRTAIICILAFTLISCGAGLYSSASTAILRVSYSGSSLSSGGDSLSLGLVPVNFSGEALELTLSNVGDLPLDLSSTISGSRNSGFSISGNSPESLNPGESTSLALSFSPSTSGQKNATLQIASNDPTTPSFSLPLSGHTEFGNSFVDGNTGTGLNKVVTDIANEPSFIVFNSKLYGVWREDNPSQIRVVVYNGNDSSPSWSFVDGDGATGINQNTARTAREPQSIVFGGKLYLTWSEQNGSAVNQIRAVVYNGNDSAPVWTFVDGNGANGLNRDVTRAAFEPEFVELNGKLYLAWYETDGTANQIRIVVYNGNDGAPAWSFVDGNAATGINKDTSRAAVSPQMHAMDNKLYVTWYETDGTANQIRIVVYNGNDSSPSWTFVDGNGSTGLNFDTSRSARLPSVNSHSSKLYLIWDEAHASGSNQIRVALYNGNDASPSWSFVDGNASTGINFNTLEHVSQSIPRLTTFRDKLYAVWTENDSTTSEPNVRLKVYNGDSSSPQWGVVDGGNITGLNFDGTKQTGDVGFVEFNNKLYLFWREWSPAFTRQVRIAVANQ